MFGRSLLIFSLLLSLTVSAPALQAQETGTPTSSAVYTDAFAGPIRTGDTLRVLIAGAEDLSGQVRVESDGAIQLPRVGAVTVVGKMPLAAAAEIEKRVKEARVLKRPNASVYIVGRKAREVIVSGAVTNQGTRQIKDEATLAEALEAALPVQNADLSRVVLTHAGVDTVINYKRFQSGEERGPTVNPVLEDGDRIYVFVGVQNEGTVRILGEVKDATKVMLPLAAGGTVGQVVQAAGGVTDYADRKGVTILRGDKRIPVPFEDILKNVPGADIVLQDKDIVSVPRLERLRQYTVAGAVREKRPFLMTTKTTLLDAIAQAGGPDDGARQNMVEVRRQDENGQLITKVYDLKKDKDAATEIREGDYIFVPYGKRRPQLDFTSVMGALSGAAIIFGQLRR